MPNKSIRTIVLENALSHDRLRPRDLARKFGVKLDTIYSETVRLRKKGLIPPAAHKFKADKPPLPQLELAVGTAPMGVAEKHKVWVQQDVDDIVNSQVMPELERLQKLSNMGRFGPDAISIAAIKALEDLGRARGTSVGPGKPLTEDEQIARLARLCIALGRDISERAFKVAFELGLEANVELQTKNSEEHGGTPEGDSPLGGLGTRIES